MLRGAAYAYCLLRGDSPEKAIASVAALEAKLGDWRDRAELMMRDAVRCTRGKDCPCPICAEDRR